jgi:hypothetical protein
VHANQVVAVGGVQRRRVRPRGRAHHDHHASCGPLTRASRFVTALRLQTVAWPARRASA